VVDTDVILDHLIGTLASEGASRPSLLRKVMAEFFCYTTVFNAVELFSICRTSTERRVVEDVMASMKVLGLNGKSAKSVGLHVSRSRTRRVVDVGSLVAGVCLESRLSLLTGRGSRYRGIRSLRLLDAAKIDASLKKGTVWS
jgi:predicted nucleic acid-binding protein